MRLLTWNILDGGRGRADAIEQVVRAQDADVVALQEANDRGVVERLGERLSMHAYWGEANSDFAVAWLSRRPGRPRNHRLPVLDKTLLELALGELRLFTTHLSAGRTLADEPHRSEEMEAVLAVAGEADVLVGDFNAVNPDDAICEPDEPLEHVSRRPIELALERGFTDAYRLLNDDPGWTYTTAQPWARFDYVFASPRLRVRGCRVVAESGSASDHFPVSAEVL